MKNSFSFTNFHTLILAILSMIFMLPGLSAQSGMNDATFNIQDDCTYGSGRGFDGAVLSIAVQPDGKVLVGGGFEQYNGFEAKSLTRLNPDGTLDMTFQTGSGFDGRVNNIIIQEDGKIMVGGDFSTYNGSACGNIIRLNGDGSMDDTFNSGAGFNGEVKSIVLTEDQYLVGGNFTSYNGTMTNYIARLNIEGTLDTTFAIGDGFDDRIKAIGIQSTGKIIVLGNFNYFDNIKVDRLVRLNEDGTLDSSFTVIESFTLMLTLFVLPDDKIICGGLSKIMKIEENGKTDYSFKKPIGSVWIHTLTIFDDNHILVGGDFQHYDLIPNLNIVKIDFNGVLDTTFSSKLEKGARVLAIQKTSENRIFIGGSFYTYDSFRKRGLARISDEGMLDMSFNPGSSFDDYISDMVIQPDGKIIASGAFTAFAGSPSKRIARLTEDGLYDASFQVGEGFDSELSEIALQSDGKIIVGGYFSNYQDADCNLLARLNSDGTLDTTFQQGLGVFGVGVNSVGLQADGKILIVGPISMYNGFPAKSICRINSDGSFDETFITGTGVVGTVFKILFLPDGKILVGGNFTAYNGNFVNDLIRLNTDGSLDQTFNCGDGFNDMVIDMVVLPNGQYVITGRFTLFNGMTAKRIIRLNPDGTPDPTFEVGDGFNETVFSVLAQQDGKLLVGGQFSQFDLAEVKGIIRLNEDGSIDQAFDSGDGFDYGVLTLHQVSDEKVLAGGIFSTYDGHCRNRIVRLINDIDVSIDNIHQEIEATVYPNPTNGSIMLDIRESGIVSTVCIRNIYGQELLRMDRAIPNQLQLEIHGPSGIYLVEVVMLDGSRKVMQVFKN